MAPKEAPGPDSWLEEDFEPNKATAAYLRGVFLQNDIQPPSNAKKADLVKLFHAKITPLIESVRATRAVAGSARGIRDLRDARPQEEDSSDDDMDVDEPAPPRNAAGRGKLSARVAKNKASAKRTRVSRSQSASVVDSDDEETGRKELKRPRVSTKKANRQAEPAREPTPIKEEDEMQVDEPPRKASPKRASPTRASPEDKPSRASLEGRRRSSGQHRSSEDAESGFSDYNPFQESERKKRRKSSMGGTPLAHVEEMFSDSPPPPIQRKHSPERDMQKPFPSRQPAQTAPARRKSMSALHEDRFELDLPEPPATAERRNKPRATMPAPGRSGMSSSTSMPAFSNYMVPVEQLKAPADRIKEIVKRQSLVPQQQTQPQHHRPVSSSSSPVTTKKGGSPETGRRSSFAKQPSPQPLRPRASSGALQKLPHHSRGLQQLLALLLGTLMLSGLGLWRHDRFRIGYCDSTGVTTFDHRAALWPLGLEPSCMPCPSNGHCFGGELKYCDAGYIRTPSLLSLGGLMPVGDSCEPDTAMLKRVALQKKAINRVLRLRRGEVDCGRRSTTLALPKHQRGQRDMAWKAFGVSEAELKQQVALLIKTRSDPETFGSDFEQAIKDLSFGDLLSGVQDEITYYAAEEADLPLTCAARRASWTFAKANKSTLSGLAFVLWLYSYLSSAWRTSKQEQEQVNELVDLALDKLQQQMTWNYRDPVLTPFARMASAQLRDDVLSHEHSDKQRARLWKRAEKVILKNANVRRLEAEYHGEPTTCWEWIGSPLLIEDEPEGRRSRRQSRAGPRVSFAGANEERIYPTL